MDAIYPCCEEDDQYDAMVQCGRCKKWHHLSCVGVDQSIAEHVWFCRTCLGEDVSARESLGQPGISRVQPPRAAKKGSVRENTGKSRDNTKKSAGLKDPKEIGRQSVHQEKISKEQGISLVGLADKSNTEVLVNARQLSAANQPRRRTSGSSKQSNSESHHSVEKSNKSGSDKTKSSKRDMAMKRIDEIKERSRLEALEEETQLQILKVKQRQIERQRRELEELQQLSRLVEEGSEYDEEQGESEISYIDKVQGWINVCEPANPGRSRQQNIASEAGASQFSLNLRRANENEMISKELLNVK
nr:transcription factor bye1-like [Aedes albopictus]